MTCDKRSIGDLRSAYGCSTYCCFSVYRYVCRSRKLSNQFTQASKHTRTNTLKHTQILQANYNLTRTFRKTAETFRILCFEDLSDYCPESPKTIRWRVFPKWRNNGIHLYLFLCHSLHAAGGRTDIRRDLICVPKCPYFTSL